MHFCVMFVCDQLHNLRQLRQLCHGNTIYSISIFSLRKKRTYNFATTKLVLLPGLAPGSNIRFVHWRVSLFTVGIIIC